MTYIYSHPPFISPNSLTKQAGGTATGTVSDVQTWNDGNIYSVAETTGTPGFEIDFDFTNVAKIYGVVSSLRYDGSDTHEVTLRIRDYTAAADVELLSVADSGSHYQYRTVLLPDDSDLIDGSDNAQLILYHNSAGNASHDVYIEYIALIGRPK